MNCKIFFAILFIGLSTCSWAQYENQEYLYIESNSKNKIHQIKNGTILVIATQDSIETKGQLTGIYKDLLVLNEKDTFLNGQIKAINIFSSKNKSLASCAFPIGFFGALASGVAFVAYGLLVTIIAVMDPDSPEMQKYTTRMIASLAGLGISSIIIVKSAFTLFAKRDFDLSEKYKIAPAS